MGTMRRPYYSHLTYPELKVAFLRSSELNAFHLLYCLPSILKSIHVNNIANDVHLAIEAGAHFQAGRGRLGGDGWRLRTSLFISMIRQQLFLVK